MRLDTNRWTHLWGDGKVLRVSKDIALSTPQALVLDDDTDVREVVTNALESEGYHVVRCSTKAELDRALKSSSIDIFLLDVMLPDGNGVQIARELRKATQAGIILLTGLREELDQVLGLEIGADDYITKPFSIRTLRARVNAVFRRTAGSLRRAHPTDTEEGTLQLCELLLFPAARIVKRLTGEAVDLTTTEFDVLMALASRPNRVLTRDQIMDEVRGPDWAAYDRTVDGLISRLRAKLFPDGTGPQRIKTVRGVGYMLSKAQ